VVVHGICDICFKETQLNYGTKNAETKFGYYVCSSCRSESLNLQYGGYSLLRCTVIETILLLIAYAPARV